MRVSLPSDLYHWGFRPLRQVSSGFTALKIFLNCFNLIPPYFSFSWTFILFLSLVVLERTQGRSPEPESISKVTQWPSVISWPHHQGHFWRLHGPWLLPPGTQGYLPWGLVTSRQALIKSHTRPLNSSYSKEMKEMAHNWKKTPSK